MKVNALPGWYPIAYSDEIPTGGVDPIEYFGREMVLYRGEDGEPRVLDAHCRHLGAHLGYGGKVEGSSIRCPFHAWRWTRDGRCDEIPYATKIPPGAKLRSWPVCERNGLILLLWGSDDSPIPDGLPVGTVPVDRLTRRWVEEDRVPRLRRSEGHSAGPALCVDRRGDLVVWGGWTPVDDRRGHLRVSAFTDAESADPHDHSWRALYLPPNN